jgi:S1-C subfamily serine protease
MECPKCKHLQEATDKCESCGVYFSKLGTRPPEQKPARANRPRPDAVESKPGITPFIVTAVVAGLLVFVFMRKGKETPEAANDRPSPVRTVVQLDDSGMGKSSTQLTSSPAAAAVQPAAFSPADAGKPLEAARNATVLIETGLGLGSGFIVDAQCHVVTNRHVVDLDGKRIAQEVVNDPRAREAMRDAQMQLQEEIYEAQRHLRAIRNQPGANLEAANLEHQIEEMQKRLDDPAKYLKNNVANKVDRAGRAGFTATLPDGSRYDSLYARYSDKYDLALFQLPSKFCTGIKSGRSKELSYGQRLFTIGNPSGLVFTLTSGVYSGERFDGETRYLQTDAPINPGNSGGPLLTEDGRVIGINSLVLRDTQGIGFALPIEAAYEAFPELGSPD